MLDDKGDAAKAASRPNAATPDNAVLPPSFRPPRPPSAALDHLSSQSWSSSSSSWGIVNSLLATAGQTLDVVLEKIVDPTAQSAAHTTAAADAVPPHPDFSGSGHVASDGNPIHDHGVVSRGQAVVSRGLDVFETLGRYSLNILTQPLKKTLSQSSIASPPTGGENRTMTFDACFEKHLGAARLHAFELIAENMRNKASSVSSLDDSIQRIFSLDEAIERLELERSLYPSLTTQPGALKTISLLTDLSLVGTDLIPSEWSMRLSHSIESMLSHIESWPNDFSKGVSELNTLVSSKSTPSAEIGANCHRFRNMMLEFIAEFASTTIGLYLRIAESLVLQISHVTHNVEDEPHKSAVKAEAEGWDVEGWDDWDNDPTTENNDKSSSDASNGMQEQMLLMQNMRSVTLLILAQLQQCSDAAALAVKASVTDSHQLEPQLMLLQIYHDMGAAVTQVHGSFACFLPIFAVIFAQAVVKI